MKNVTFTNYRLSSLQHSMFNIRCSIFIFPIFLIFSFSLPAQQWTEPINISNLGGYSKDPDLVIDHKGVIHVVWSYRITQTHWLIMYNYSEDDGQTWTEPLDLLQNTDLWMSQPHIACDSKNKLYVTYTHDYHGWTPEGRLIKILTCDEHQWSEPIIVSEGMPGSHYNNIIIDHNDRIYVFWDHGPSGDDFYRFFEKNLWSGLFCPYPGGDEIYALVEAVISEDNSIHWIGGSAGTTYYGERLQYFFYDYAFNTWYPAEQPVQDTIMVGLDIALNINEFPESAYRKKTTISVGFVEDLTMHIYKKVNYWSSPVLVAETTGTQKYQQIAIDQNNDVHIVEQNETIEGYGLLHYKKKGETWIGQFIDSCYIVRFPKLLFSDNKLYCLYSKTWEVEKEVDSDLFFTKYDIITNINEEAKQANSLTIYPNPGRDNITIEFENNKHQHINLSVYSLAGQHIVTLINETKPPGVYRQLWKGKGNRKENAPGLYHVCLQSGRKTVTQTVEIVK